MTPKDLLKWWMQKFPREMLGDEDGPTWKGKRALKDLEAFSETDIQNAMDREIARDKPKKIDNVIAYLQNKHGVSRTEGPTWLTMVEPGTMVTQGKHTGIVIQGGTSEEPVYEVFVIRETRMYKRKHFIQVLPEGLERRWNFMDPIKGGEVRREWSDLVKAGDIDGYAYDESRESSCEFARQLGHALRLNPHLVEASQARFAKPKKTKSAPRISTIGGLADQGFDEIEPEHKCIRELTAEDKAKGHLF